MKNKYGVLKSRILTVAVAGLTLGIGVQQSYAETPSTVKETLLRMGRVTNYSWTKTTETPDTPFTVPTIKGKAELNGFTVMDCQADEINYQAVIKNGRGVVMIEAEWKTYAEIMSSNDGDMFEARELLNTKTPIDELSLLIPEMSGLNVEPDGSYIGTLDPATSEEVVNELIESRAPISLKAASSSGTLQLWIKDGLPQKYILTVVGSVSLPFGKKEIKKISTVNISDIGTTNVAVPAEAKEKLETVQEIPAGFNTTEQAIDYNKKTSSPINNGSAGRPPLFDVGLESSYTVAGGTKFRGSNVGDSGAFSVGFGLSGRIPINQHWIVPLGIQSQNLVFDTLKGTPIPENIHTIQFSTGLGFRPNDNWMFMARISPTLYKLSDLEGNDLGLSGGLMAMLNITQGLNFVIGINVSPDSDLKVLPMAGFNWVINSRFVLNIILPEPRLIYTPNENWRFYVGADMSNVTFRTDDSLGTSIGMPQYNDALGTYRDIRTGVGVGYQITRLISLEVDAGYSVNRQIDYTKLNKLVKFDPAPYVLIGIKVGS